ncbi:hypothetical protein FD49_GL000104 [Latilactobacillus sakei subsp. sakei DSM 20017 = JCM 1157]|nr:hypothetical protein [Latilactobacillus sakei]KGB14838.1 hypothetical protein KY41_05635 [Latilactobacillus sakei]KRK72002.1 hypothetical protein FD49_GL000104 [Latilactobacillus sakei subsp. sakei DSM 20017 = JCM 1157]MDG9751561.1 hypothetical protein [Latilactobacillus sakei]MDM5044531.1 hypothetical protein [Latilactobacillus sakei]QMU86057.1 hypothetical protein H3M14_08165 [Latilactobacillus sakei]
MMNKMGVFMSLVVTFVVGVVVGWQVLGTKAVTQEKLPTTTEISQSRQTNNLQPDQNSDEGPTEDQPQTSESQSTADATTV